jgi:hypothetical protein
MRAFGKAYVAWVIEGENIPALSARKCMKKSGEAGFFHLGLSENPWRALSISPKSPKGVGFY